MKLTVRKCTTLEVNVPHNTRELLQDLCFYRETYSEFENKLYLPKSSITDASEEFKKTEIYTALKDVFDNNPTYTDLMLITG